MLPVLRPIAEDLRRIDAVRSVSELDDVMIQAGFQIGSLSSDRLYSHHRRDGQRKVSDTS